MRLRGRVSDPNRTAFVKNRSDYTKPAPTWCRGPSDPFLITYTKKRKQLCGGNPYRQVQGRVLGCIAPGGVEHHSLRRGERSVVVPRCHASFSGQRLFPMEERLGARPCCAVHEEEIFGCRASKKDRRGCVRIFAAWQSVCLERLDNAAPS